MLPHNVVNKTPSFALKMFPVQAQQRNDQLISPLNSIQNPRLRSSSGSIQEGF